MTAGPLVVIESHPVQYHAPVYRAIREMGVPVTAVYGSDFSVAGYHDPEFGASFSWDVDLLSGYTPRFLSRVSQGGPASVDGVDKAHFGQSLSKVLGEVGPSAILLTGHGTSFERASIQAASRSGVPLLYRAETTDHALGRSRAKALARDLFLRRLYRRMAWCLYIGEQSMRHYDRLGVTRLAPSLYCVSTQPFETDDVARDRLRAATRASLGIGTDRRVLLFSGKLSERKGVDLLIEAVRGLPAASRDALTVLLVGDGARRESLGTMALLEPGVDVRFAGFRPQRELSAFYHAADAFVLPSRLSETWGLVVNEALHHGLPCVVSDQVGCAPDLIVTGETGETVAAGSAGALRVGIERLFGWWSESPGARARCRAQVAPYSVEAAARGIADAYRAAVSQ